MRNLRNVDYWLSKSPTNLHLTASTWDVATDSIICTFGPTKDNPLLDLKRLRRNYESSGPNVKDNDVWQDIASWDAPVALPGLKYDRILNLHHFSDISTTCLVFAGGDLVLVREDPQFGEERIEIVGSVDAGISAAVWSPDEELLVITTNANTCLYMTRDFDNTVNISFSADDLKASKHVSVGWGKAETQFKGKKSRLLKDPTVPDTIDEGTVSELDAGETTISWRGDGAFVAVNAIESGRRVIRVYSHEGTLDSASEPVNGLLGALSWRPAGNLLAGLQHRNAGFLDVVFFERNGLRHGQFPLRLTKNEILHIAQKAFLQWNLDSSVLAVCLGQKIQLWTMSNYYYFLKQEIDCSLSTPAAMPMLLKWHPEKPLKLLASAAGGVQSLEYNLVVSSDPNSPPNDYGITAVIDGRNVKVTPLRFANIPPPMYMHNVSLRQNAIDVAVTVVDSGGPIAFLAVLQQENVSLFEWSIKGKPPTPPELKWSRELDSSGIIHQQVSFSGAKAVSVLSKAGNQSIIAIVALESDTQGGDTFSQVEEARGLVKEIGARKSGACIILRNDSVTISNTQSIALNGHKISTLALHSISTPRVEVIGLQYKSLKYPDGTLQSEPDAFIMFGLTHNGLLFANDRVLSRSCTSFLVTPAHLIFTTSQHLLKFVHMAAPEIQDLDVPPDAPEADERCRVIERGAKLVTVMPSILALILQMPRGNLETVYPRALVLAGIRQAINDGKYKKAFLACRKHKVDLNILHDHDPQRFLTGIGAFIDQLEKMEYLDLFLSQLREEDVSKSMYKETLPAGTALTKMIESPSSKIDTKSKVNQICNTMLEALRSRTSTHSQCVITAHLCKNPLDFEAGLTEITQIKQHHPKRFDELVEHICFLADTNKLYDYALGIYDLELALAIAEQSQKDPREYLPFLQNLHQMPETRRLFSIDNHLGRHRKALSHLHEMNVSDELEAYTKKHSLYTNALALYRYRDHEYSRIMALYAEHLQLNSKFKEAGIAYEYLEDFRAASESYRLAHLWRESLSCAMLIPLADQELWSLAETLADGLIETKDYFSAATIHLDHLSNPAIGCRLLCRGYFFADAMRIICQHGHPDLLDSVLDVGLAEGMAAITELLADCKSQLNAQIPRIRELRIRKAEDPLGFLGGDASEGGDVPDNVSLAPTDTSTTGGSLFTRYTNRTGTVGTSATRKTSKNKRREERKRARGKKGSVYEEEYLVNSVSRLIEKVNSINEDVNRLIIGLTRRRMRERARAVETAMADVVQLCKHSVREVFQPGDLGERDVVMQRTCAPERLGDGDGAVLDTSSITGRKDDVVPSVVDFERLTLLGELS